ncbi:MAG TPA: integrase [Campylobacterales bacterium]|nr:integrase [Campylobacterales bacterium]
MSKELDAFIEYISVVKLLDIKTIKAYESDILQVERYIKKDAITLNLDDIINYLATQEKKTTINRKLSSLNSFFNFCQKQRFIDKKPNITLSRTSKTLPKYILHDKLMELLNLIDRSTCFGLRDYSLILFLYSTGLRVSEALNLKKNDIEKNWVKVLNAKRDKQRIVPVPNIALDAIKKYHNSLSCQKEFIWLNYQERQLSRISAFKIVKKYLNFSPHVLRHSYATELILGGADLRVVQELLGHSSIITTGIYMHLQRKDLEDSVNKFHPLSQKGKL